MKDGQEPHLHSTEGGGATDEELRKREREDVTRPIEPGEREEANRFLENPALRSSASPVSPAADEITEVITPGVEAPKEPIIFDNEIAEYEKVKGLPITDPERQRVTWVFSNLKERMWERVRAEEDDGEADRLARIAGELLDLELYLKDGRDRVWRVLDKPYDIERLIDSLEDYNLITEAASVQKMIEESGNLDPKTAMTRGYDIAVQIAKNAVGSKRREVNALSGADDENKPALHVKENQLRAAEELLAILLGYRPDISGVGRKEVADGIYPESAPRD